MAFLSQIFIALAKYSADLNHKKVIFTTLHGKNREISSFSRGFDPFSLWHVRCSLELWVDGIRHIEVLKKNIIKERHFMRKKNYACLMLVLGGLMNVAILLCGLELKAEEKRNIEVIGYVSGVVGIDHATHRLVIMEMGREMGDSGSQGPVVEVELPLGVDPSPLGVDPSPLGVDPSPLGVDPSPLGND